MFKYIITLLGALLAATDAAMVIGQFKNAACDPPAAKTSTFTANSGCQGFLAGVASIHITNNGVNTQDIEFFHDAGCVSGLGTFHIAAGASQCKVQTNGATANSYRVTFT